MWKKIYSIEQIVELKEKESLLEYPLDIGGLAMANTIPQEMKTSPENSKTYSIDIIFPDPHPTRNDPKFNIYIIRKILPDQSKAIRKVSTDFLNGCWWKED